MTNRNVKINSLIFLLGVFVFTAGGIIVTNVGTITIAYMNAMINSLTVLV